MSTFVKMPFFPAHGHIIARWRLLWATVSWLLLVPIPGGICDLTDSNLWSINAQKNGGQDSPVMCCRVLHLVNSIVTETIFGGKTSDADSKTSFQAALATHMLPTIALQDMRFEFVVEV